MRCETALVTEAAGRRDSSSAQSARAVTAAARCPGGRPRCTAAACAAATFGGAAPALHVWRGGARMRCATGTAAALSHWRLLRRRSALDLWCRALRRLYRAAAFGSAALLALLGGIAPFGRRWPLRRLSGSLLALR